jgi:hypothetical protein
MGWTSRRETSSLCDRIVYAIQGGGGLREICSATSLFVIVAMRTISYRLATSRPSHIDPNLDFHHGMLCYVPLDIR